jgi:hypothetical protein
MTQTIGKATVPGSFDLESSLRRLGDGDWIGSEELARLTP